MNKKRSSLADSTREFIAGACAELIARQANEQRGWLSSIIEEAAERCDSPIEQRFIAALLTTLDLAEDEEWRLGSEFNTIERAMSWPRLLDYEPWFLTGLTFIWPQPTIEKVRVDFGILHYGYDVTGEDHKEVFRRSDFVIVECDGHDFHERTKEQAERDRSRDRMFQSKGYKIFRFTGRELFRDPFTCVEEVTSALRCLSC